jgi:eukaryotic-like serine/threonine-protein kinase
MNSPRTTWEPSAPWNHPNIVTVYDVIHEESEMVIAMELVEGRSLREFCGSPLDPDRVIHFGRQVALALSAAHLKGIVHRDIKPENLIAREDGLVKVFDFGLAREMTAEPGAESHSTAALPAGTPRYMAPEQLRGERATAAGDVFSLGVVLYELAAGRHPFDARFTWETAHAIVSRDAAGPDSLNPAIPPGLASLILSMLANESAERPSAERVAAVLGDPTSFGKSGWELRYRRPTAAAVLIAVVVCAAWFLIVRWRATPRALSITDLTSLASENRVTAAVISPKGDQFVYAALDGMYVRTIQPSPEKALDAPQGFRCDRLGWLPDGTSVLASGSPGQGGKRGIWIISLLGAPPRLVREDAMDAAPSPDGRSIAFVTPSGSEVWIAGIDGTGERRITAGRPNESYSAILWSPDNRRIGYQRRQPASRTYEWVDLASGKLTGSFSSPFLIESASILADGRMFFLSQSNPMRLSGDLWTAEFDPHTGFVRRPAQLIARL